MVKRRSKIDREIPLFLIPEVITRQIRERGSSVYRISVRRTHWHHYNVTVRTKTIPRELAPAPSAALSSREPADRSRMAAGSRGCAG
jgi:hypothetical protein